MKFKIVESRNKDTKEKCFEIHMLKKTNFGFQWISLKKSSTYDVRTHPMQFKTKEIAREYVKVMPENKAKMVANRNENDSKNRKL